MDPVENGDNAAAGVGVMMRMPITVLMMEIQSGSKKKTVGKQRQGEDNLALKLRTRFQETNNRPTLLLKIHCIGTKNPSCVSYFQEVDTRILCGGDLQDKGCCVVVEMMVPLPSHLYET